MDMRIIYLIITSSVMICLMLLLRCIFRKKLSANVIYTLWIILYFRLLVPFGYWEVPLFGTAAEIAYRPFAVVEQLTEDKEMKNSVDYEESIVNEAPAAATKPHSESVKLYDAVVPEASVIIQNSEPAENIVPIIANNEYQLTSKTIVLGIWFSGSLIVAGYVISQNRKLRKKADTLEVVGQIDGIDICVSKELKTPCLCGVRTPKMIVTEEVLADSTLYEYAVTHELEHYKHKDHIWNAERIFMCILYWWNPLLWYAAKCVAEDAELACDERVLKNKSVEERKNYGYALLQMIENAQNKPLCFATSFSGNKSSAKQRIEAITRKTTTKKYVLFPVALLLIVLLVVGCMYPSEKSYIKTNGDNTIGETEELKYIESMYEYSLQDEFQSMLFYYETYEYGELIERRILSYGDLEKYSDAFLLRNEFYKYEENDAFVFKMDGIEISMPISKFPGNTLGISSPNLEKDLLEIKPGNDLILMAAYQSRDSDITNVSCEVIVIYDEKLTEALSKNNVVTFARLILSDLPAETLCKQMQAKEFPIEEGEGINDRMLADEWAKAFVDKDAETIMSLATEEACKQLVENTMLDEEMTAFGWSSPWPMQPEEPYKIIDCNQNGAEILYYAIDSTPHVYVWKETLEFEDVKGELKVSSWLLQRYNVISKLDEYRNAYPKNQIADTPMDYYTNGLGEALNNNALLSSSDTYQALFEPGSAALELLNVSKDYSLVHYITRENDVDVDIQFLNENGSTGSTSVTMWQPYGESGIWIPKGEEMLSLDEYNEKYSKKEFSEEPEEKKVCLAVMPDGISRAGGDYRYIIPEDQVKWTDHYKQARSLAVDGTWKDGERSAGIWIVFNDEWTCITEQGMIFDFEKRVEKEEIENFYNLCLEEAKKYGTGTPLRSENVREIRSAVLEYNGIYTVTDDAILTAIEKQLVSSPELRGGAACPFTASLTLEFIDNRTETIYLATDSCAVWLTDGVYHEYSVCEDIEEVYNIFKEYGKKSESDQSAANIIEH